MFLVTNPMSRTSCHKTIYTQNKNQIVAEEGKQKKSGCYSNKGNRVSRWQVLVYKTDGHRRPESFYSRTSYRTLRTANRSQQARKPTRTHQLPLATITHQRWTYRRRTALRRGTIQRRGRLPAHYQATNYLVDEPDSAARARQRAPSGRHNNASTNDADGVHHDELPRGQTRFRGARKTACIQRSP